MSEKELEIQRLLLQLREAEEALKEYRARGLALEEEVQLSQQREQEAAEELEQIKADFEAVISFKNELELLIEEQTQHVDQRNKRLAAVEETLRFREQELEKKEGLLRRVS